MGKLHVKKMIVDPDFGMTIHDCIVKAIEICYNNQCDVDIVHNDEVFTLKKVSVNNFVNTSTTNRCPKEKEEGTKQNTTEQNVPSEER